MTQLLTMLVFIALLAVWAHRSIHGLWPFKKDKAAEHMQDGSDTITRQMANHVLDGMTEKLQGLAEYDDLTTKKATLESQIVRLEDRILGQQRDIASAEEDFKRQRRDLEHEVGLMKKQLEHELKNGLENADLGAEKKIVAAEKKFNNEALANAKASHEKQLKSTEEITKRLFRLVPNLEASLKVSRKDS